MPFRWDVREHVQLGRYVLKWLLIATPVGVVIGSAVALFLWLLDAATTTRWEHPWLLYLLPLAGLGIAWAYQRAGESVASGNNLILEQINEPSAGVPTRMAPLVLAGTVVTHLFGGSAGREGTAVQMGGSIASSISRWFRFNSADTRTLLMAGIAGGFGAVFGTPLAGAIFAVEVLAIGRLSYEALVPCLIASVVGDWTTSMWGTPHTHYHIADFARLGLLEDAPRLSWTLAGKVTVAAVAFGLASVLFAELSHGFHYLFKTLIRRAVLRPVVGGLLVIGLVHLLGTRDYLGLGVAAPPDDPQAVTILSCFREGGAESWSWWWKLLFTAITLSSGFKGGEVTPLFFVGAALGNTLAQVLGAPVDLFAALGFVAVFAGATNTPLASTIMAIELFGPHDPGLLNTGFVIYVAMACFLAYLFSGHSGIYLSQRIGTPKIHGHVIPETTLSQRREAQAEFTIPTRWGADRDLADAHGDLAMPDRHHVHAREVGQLRIFLRASQRKKGAGRLGSLFTRPAYQEIIDLAKTQGLMNAVAHASHYGYSDPQGALPQPPPQPREVRHPALTMCVELIGEPEALKLFCRTHAELLQGMVVVYKPIEHWDIRDSEIVSPPSSEDEPRADSGGACDDTNPESS